MTDALEFYIKDWERIIWDATGDQTKVDRLMELARLNGMFDPIKMIPAPQALAVTPAVGGEVLRDAIMGAARLYTHDHTTAHKIAETAMATLAAQPASSLRGMEDLAPSPCSDLSIGELIEWLDNPQWTNGYLNSDAANHMSAAAELIERLVSSTPPEQPAAVSQEALDWAAAESEKVEAYKAANPDWQNHTRPAREVFAQPAAAPATPTNLRQALIDEAKPLRYGEPVWPGNENDDLDKGDDA